MREPRRSGWNEGKLGSKNVAALRETEGGGWTIIPRFSPECQGVVEFSLLSQAERWGRVEVGEGGGASQGAGEAQEER